MFKRTLFAAGLLLLSYAGVCQQRLGSFSAMDGGFEGQTGGSLSSTSGSSSPIGGQWTRGGSSGSGNGTIFTTGGRSGGQYLSVVNTRTGTSSSPRTYLSPWTVDPAKILPSTSYIIQLYCKASDGVNFPTTLIQAGISSAIGTGANYTTFTPSGTPGVFTKYTIVVTSPSTVYDTGYSAVKISSANTNPGYGLDIDDWVVYPGTTADVTPPSEPGIATTSNPTGYTMNVNWGASASTDGGGYVVVRYAANPTGQPNPNTNGIYKAGNAIGTGTIVYIGTATGFVDFGLANNTTYFYRVYTADKAFNYSAPVITSGTTNTEAPSLRYYLDFNTGDDANDGSINAPWKNLSRLAAQTIPEGTSIYLKCGSVWTGQQLKFNGSGTALHPIVIDKYGTGATPLLAGNGLTGEAVVYLYNQQYIEINNLEITNSPNGPVDANFFVGLYENGTNPLGGDRRGVMVALDKFGTASHIYLKNLNIHHIKGQLGNGQTALNGAIPKRTGGIYFSVLGNTEQTNSLSRFNDVLIDSCTVAYCENIGLAFDNEWNVYYPGGNEYNDWFSRRFSNVKVSNNVLHHIGKNAMIIRCKDSTGLIERNVCYETALGTTGNTMFTARARGTVFQFNEGYYNRATTQNVSPGSIDGSMYDPDFGSIGIIFQYSYSHDNSHGIYWGCNTRSASNNTSGIPDPEDKGCTLRYCVSQNDLGNLVFFNYSSAGNEIYNNVFYIRQGTSPNIISENSGNSHTYNYFNNIVYNLSTSSGVYNFGTTNQFRTIQNNVFYGNHPSTEPADPFKQISNPLLMGPGTGTLGLNSLNGYKLAAGSPALNSGRIISNNGGRDFFGTALPTTAPNRGIYQGPGVGACTPTSSTTNITTCNSYTWNGITYTVGGTYTKTGLVNKAGCDSTATLQLTIQPRAGFASITSDINPICTNDSFTLRVNGVTGLNPSITWRTRPQNDPAGTLVGTGVSVKPTFRARTYYVVVQSACGDSKEDSIVITAKLSSTYTVVQTSCFSVNDGAITNINVTGGTAPYGVTFTPATGYTNTTSFTNLSPKSYRLYYRDATGCEGISPSVAVIATKLAMQVSATKTDATCFNTLTGSINNIATVNGVSPYAYTLNPTTTPYQAVTSFSSLRGGNYRIYVQDANGCKGTSGIVTIGQQAAIVISFTKTDAVCGNLRSGTITVTGVTGGSGSGYQVSFNPAGPFSSNMSFTGLPAGNYRVYCRDSRGCVGNSAIITIAACTNNPRTMPQFTTVPLAGQALQIYPNPSTGLFTVQLPTGRTARSILTITNEMGTIIATRQVPATAGNNVDIDLQGQVPGVYTVSVLAKDKKLVTKIVVTKR